LFVVTHQALLLEAWPMNLCWMQAGADCWTQRRADSRRLPLSTSNEFALGGDPCDDWSKISGTGVALERTRCNSHAVFLVAGWVVIFVFSFDPLAEESRHIVGGLGVGSPSCFAAVVGAPIRLGRASSQPSAGCVSGFSGFRPMPLFLAKRWGILFL